MEGVHEYEIEVDPASIDANGHVNNVEFVRWMQDAAVRHADAAGCTAATRNAGATWVARSHKVEYRRPAFAGDRVLVQTWVVDYRKAFSARGYRFSRDADGVVLASGETDWVFVDVKSARPRTIPDDVRALFVLRPTGVDEPRM